MSEARPRHRGASVVTGYAAVALLGLAACAPSKPKTAPTPMNDPRVGLKAGLFDADPILLSFHSALPCPALPFPG